MSNVKKCAFCNKMFTPKSNRQIYCKGPHYHICPICGKQTEVTNVEKLKFPPTACSYQCRAIKTRQTSLEKYGCAAPGNSVEGRKKAKATCLKNNGVEYAMQSPIVREKSRITNLEKYGCENAGQNEHVIQKRMETNRRKYGDTMPFNTPECYEKQHQTMIEKYGVPYFPMSQEFLKHSKIRISNLNKQFISKLNELNIECVPELGLGTKIYDIAIPTMRTVIEINPTYTHNSFGNHWNEYGLPGDYHLIKTQIAEENGYKCIHVWDWDDWDKIINLIKEKQTISANTLSLYKLSESSAEEFMNNNHLDGWDVNTVMTLGLVRNNQIYQAMSFAKSKTSKYYAELSRVATLQGYEIDGGAKVLFNYATNEFGLSRIVAYADVAKSNGFMFEQMGMLHVNTTPPREIWSKKQDKMIRSRKANNITRSKLLEDGWLPVYDCGQKVYEYI